MGRLVFPENRPLVGYSEPKHVFSLTPSGHRKALEYHRSEATAGWKINPPEEPVSVSASEGPPAHRGPPPGFFQAEAESGGLDGTIMRDSRPLFTAEYPRVFAW